MAAGFTANTFKANANFSTATVDTGATYASGYQWYPWNFFGDAPDTTGVSVGAGTLTLTADGTNENNVVSAAQINTAPYFVGTAFGGGGYFETVITFNPNGMANAQIWPAVWAMSLEHLFQQSPAGGNFEQWIGQTAGYVHFFEVDTFEFDRGNTTQYGSTLHDWYGIFQTTCSPSNYCATSSSFGAGTVTPPVGTDFTMPHKIGWKWIAATSTTSGSHSFYFDDVLVAGPFTYTQFTQQSPPPTGQPWLFGVGDIQHLVMILGGGLNAFNILRVNVWQATTVNNMKN